MGRLATDLAAAVANVDNLPSKEQIPQTSIWDAFLPKSLTDLSPAPKKKPLDPKVGMRVKREFYNVKQSPNGKKVMVAHKTRSNASGEAKNDKNNEGAKKVGNEKGGNEKGGQGKKNDGGGGGGGGDKPQQKDRETPWTDEEDAKLKELKGKSETWANIGQEIGRSKKQVQDRWKEINNADGVDADAAAKNDGAKKDNSGKKDGEDKGENKKADKKADKSRKKEATEKKAPSVAGSNGQARFTMKEWMTLQEDDLFSFGELQCLSELMMRDERHRWMHIASAFYDKTGRRVHPEDIHDKFLEMGSVGSQR